MEERMSLEQAMLEEAIEKKLPVRLIFTTGFQCEAIIEDYCFDVIRCTSPGPSGHPPQRGGHWTNRKTI